MDKLIVCAAIRNKETKLIICGARHGNCLNLAAELKAGKTLCSETWELGFIDQDNNFLTRSEAWKIADKAGQIRRPTGFEQNYSQTRKANVGDEGLLFSENLY